LADIGLVADVNEARSYVGTEGFIPPEGPGTPQADVFSLGKVLYEASTGKDRQDFPELPTLLDKLPDPEAFLELNEVILNACRNPVSQRYQSAWAMHADLLILANGKSVKRLKMLERRFSNLKKIAGISALAMLALSVISIQVYREWRNVIASRQRLVVENIISGERSVESGNLLEALPYFVDAWQLDRGNAQQEAAHRLRFNSTLAQCPKLTHLWFLGGDVHDGEFSPDGKKVLIAKYFGKAAIYDLASGKLCSATFGPAKGLCTANFSPDMRFILTASEESTASIWNSTNLEEVLRLSHPDTILGAKFSKDGLRAITACDDGNARVWNARTGQLELLLKRHTGRVRFANFSNDGRLIVTGGEDATAILWDATTGQPIGKPLEHTPLSWVKYAAFSPDNQTLVTACSDHTARVWDVATGKPIRPNLLHHAGVECAEFSPDGRLIVTSSFDRTVRLWHADTLQPFDFNPSLKHSSAVTHVSFSPDSRRIITTCTDGSVRVWDLAGSAVPPIPVRRSFSRDGSRFLGVKEKNIEVGNTSTANATFQLAPESPLLERAEFSRNGRFIVSIGLMQTPSGETNRLLEVWDATSGKLVAPGLLVSNSVVRALPSDDGKRLVVFGGKMAQTWDVTTRAPLSQPLLHDESVASAIFNPAGNLIATRSGTNAYAWEADSGRAKFAPLNHPRPVTYVDFSPDGSRLVTCCADDQIYPCFAQVWNADSGQPVGARLVHPDGVLFASFSPDGTRIATASEDFTAQVWDVATSRQLGVSLWHNEQVHTVSFSPDNRWVVTSSIDRSARVWSAETGYPLTPPLRHIHRLDGAKFLADGHRIVASDFRGNAWIWELPLDKIPMDDLKMISRLLSGNLSNSTDGLASSKSKSPEAMWERLQAQYPSNFTVSAQEIEAWHEFEAEDSEANQEWYAAVFHLQQLLSLHPDSPKILDRLTRANEHLKSQN
jgi:WD40 repeat protein